LDDDASIDISRNDGFLFNGIWPIHGALVRTTSLLNTKFLPVSLSARIKHRT